MKFLTNTIIAACLILIISGCGEKRIDRKKLQERNKLLYEVNSETPFTGIVVEWYDNGEPLNRQKKSETHYKDGKKNGPVTLWYENGQKEVEGTFKDGKADGLVVGWYKNGQKMYEETFKDDVSTGNATAWYENGEKDETLSSTPSVMRENLRRIVCSNNLKQIGLALRMYSNANDDKFPSKDGAAGLDMLRSSDLLSHPKLFVCISGSDTPAKKGEPLTEDTTSYVYFGGFNEADSVNIPLAFDKPDNHDKYVNILFIDGHVKGYTGSTFNTCKDVVEFLLQRKQYTKEEANLLMKKAVAADKRLKR